MKLWLATFGAVYLLLLGLAMWRAYRSNRTGTDYLLAGSRVGVFFGFLSFSATLFSTFTLMGMPDFFRIHGVGAWIFLGVTDGAMAFLLLWFGTHLRKRVASTGFTGMSGFIMQRTESRWAGGLSFVTLFLFLVPYVSIQIRGISIFMAAIFPAALPVWGWAVLILAVMLLYSEIGGLKAIIYSDAIQGVLLLGATWLIATQCIGYFGSVGGMMEQVANQNPALVSTPGPKGLFDVHFLIASLVALALIPMTQPQLMTRIVIMRDMRAMQRMAVAVGIFSILVILPALFIGLYGAVLYPDSDTAHFLAQALVQDRSDALAAAVIVGLLAAAMSTADSQIFALGAELRSLLKGEEHRLMAWTRVAIFVFAISALVFSILSSDQLVLLARTCFAGTSLLAPLVLTCVLADGRPARFLVAATATGVAIYMSSLVGLFPDRLLDVRMELAILIVLAAIGWWLRPRDST